MAVGSIIAAIMTAHMTNTTSASSGPHDGGPFIGSGSLVIMRDPDDGWINASIYRVQVHGANKVTVQFDHGGRHGAAREKSGTTALSQHCMRFLIPIRDFFCEKRSKQSGMVRKAPSGAGATAGRLMPRLDRCLSLRELRDSAHIAQYASELTTSPPALLPSAL